MCPPDYFTVRDVKNPFMNPERAIDAALAREQWDALRAAFTTAGVETQVVDAVEDLEDMVFAANQSYVGSGSAHSRFAVPSAMRYASRRREVPYFTQWFVDRGFEVIDLDLDVDAGEYLEGHGDLLQHPGDAHVWAGFGFRSSSVGVARFSAAMETENVRVTPIELADENFYHLDTCFAPLNSEAALVYSPAFTQEALATLRGGWGRLHEVDRDAALSFACNGIAVNGYFVVAHPSDAVVKAVRSEGLVPLVVDTSEFEKAGGSVFCMKTFLD
jgi:N-dimethylarginine dimethylaminohydrolase